MSEPQDQAAPQRQYVFVVTYGRSGSTLVQNLLNAIDGYCIRGENNNVLGPMVRAWDNLRRAEVMRGLANRGEATGPEHPWYGGELPVPSRFGQSLARVFQREILNPPAAARAVGFKEIRWANDPAMLPMTLNFLHQFFKPARFIFNTRDHDEVARSGWWAKQDADKVKAQLQKAEEAFTRYQTNNPDRCLHIHYNDYVADHAALRPLFDFLGEPYDAALVDRVMARELKHLKQPSVAAPADRPPLADTPATQTPSAEPK